MTENIRSYRGRGKTSSSVERRYIKSIEPPKKRVQPTNLMFIPSHDHFHMTPEDFRLEAVQSILNGRPKALSRLRERRVKKDYSKYKPDAKPLRNYSKIDL